MILTKEQIMKYKNPDKRCKYPFTCDPLGYCWSYAHHVDGTPSFENMDSICPSCELWNNETGGGQ